jgi:4'-phosphopantetheinyl transferase
LSRISFPGVPDRGVLIVMLEPHEIDSAALQDDLAMLDADERARHARFVATRHRHQFAVARVMLRCVLGRLTGVAPQDVVLVRDASGKPRLADARGLQFNLSHCEGMVALAVARDRRVGLDIEDAVRPQPGFELVVDDHLAPAERAWVRAVAGDARLARFVELWTLKEAYVKAIGLGLAKRLAECVFDCPDEPGALAFRDAAPGVQPPTDWEFSQWSLSGGLRMALALEAQARRPGGEPEPAGAVEAFVVRSGAVMREPSLTRLRRGCSLQRVGP